MAALEDLLPNGPVRGDTPDGSITFVAARWFGSQAVGLIYKGAVGKPGNVLLNRREEPRLEVIEFGRPWSSAGDSAHIRLVSEAHWIRLMHLFDPLFTVYTPFVDPLQQLTIWEMVHHKICVFKSGGDVAAAALGGEAESARELACRVYTVCERKRRTQEALVYNGLVQNSPEVVRFAWMGAPAHAGAPVQIEAFGA